MSVYFYFPLNFTHCWVSLLTDCLWWYWRSTNAAEEVVHITPPHCSISPRKTSLYLISWRRSHSHPSVRMSNLLPSWECVYMMHLSGCSCGHSRKTVCTLHLCRREESDSTCTLKALSTFVSHICSAFKSFFPWSSQTFFDLSGEKQNLSPPEHRGNNYSIILKCLIIIKNNELRGLKFKPVYI